MSAEMTLREAVEAVIESPVRCPGDYHKNRPHHPGKECPLVARHIAALQQRVEALEEGLRYCTLSRASCQCGFCYACRARALLTPPPSAGEGEPRC